MARAATKKKASKPTSKAVAKAPTDTNAALAQYGFDMGEQETFDREDIAIPFIRVLQSNSPQVNKRGDEYVEGAEPGCIINTANKKLFSGEEGVLVTPVNYKRAFVEWIPRSQGGGFVREWSLAEAAKIKDKLQPNQNGSRVVIPASGNELIETMYHTVFVWDGAEPYPAVIAMKSTELPEGRRWNTNIAGISEVPVGKRPWLVYKITSSYRSNEKGEWFVMVVESTEQRTMDKYAMDFLDCEDFYGLLTAGKAPKDVAERVTAFWNGIQDFGRQSAQQHNLAELEGAQVTNDGSEATDEEAPY